MLHTCVEEIHMMNEKFLGRELNKASVFFVFLGGAEESPHLGLVYLQNFLENMNSTTFVCI